VNFLEKSCGILAEIRCVEKIFWGEKKISEATWGKIYVIEKVWQVWSQVKNVRDKIFTTCDVVDTAWSQSMNAAADATSDLMTAAWNGEKTDWFGEKHCAPSEVPVQKDTELTDQQQEILRALENESLERFPRMGM